jgi:hypothetical protein
VYNFYNVTRNISNFRRGYVTDPYDEPTYLSFGIDFNFDGVETLTGDNHLWESPLFAKGDRAITHSARTYLGSIGRNDMEDALGTFRNLLEFITTQAPWYFQSISGLDAMHEAATDMFKVKKYDQMLTIETLEAVDLRITQLANLYRAAIYDKGAMLARVPDNLRWFSMNIFIAETRNIRFEIPGLAGNAANALGINTAAINGVGSRLASSLSGLGLADDANSTIKQFGYVKFKCRQCEFDFSNTFAGGQKLDVVTSNTPNTNQFGIKVGYFEEESGYYDGTKLYDNTTRSEVNNPWGIRNTLRDATNVLNTAAGLPFVGNLAAKGIEATSNSLKNIGGLTNKVTAPIADALYAPVKEMGDIYPDLQRSAPPTDLGDVYQ